MVGDPSFTVMGEKILFSEVEMQGSATCANLGMSTDGKSKLDILGHDRDMLGMIAHKLVSSKKLTR